MAIHGYCCDKMIVLSEQGAGTDLGFDCGEFMKSAPASDRLNVCQQLFNADRMCVDIAPYCEPFKDEMLRERSRVRDDRELTDPSASPFGPMVDTALDVADGVPIPGFGEAIADAHDSAATVVSAMAPYRNEIHAALDVAGFIPVLGVAADGANALIYAAEGEWPSAAISALAMVAVIGDGAKLSAHGVRITKEAAERLGKEGLEEAIRQAARETLNAADELGGLGVRIDARAMDVGAAATAAERASEAAVRRSLGAARKRVDGAVRDATRAREAANRATEAAQAARRTADEAAAAGKELSEADAEALARAEAAAARAETAAATAELAARQLTEGMVRAHPAEAVETAIGAVSRELAAGRTESAEQIIRDLTNSKSVGQTILREMSRVIRERLEGAHGPVPVRDLHRVMELLDRMLS